MFSFFFFNDTATTEIYTLSLHDALPICDRHGPRRHRIGLGAPEAVAPRPRATRIVPVIDAEEKVVAVRTEQKLGEEPLDRKSTRLNSSHGYISYAVFCLKKKKNEVQRTTTNPTPKQIQPANYVACS